MISSTLRPRVRALMTILGLDLFGGEPELRRQTAAPVAADDDDTHRAGAAAPAPVAGGLR